MENWIKVYEEVLNETIETEKESQFWLNKVLKDEEIPFQNKVEIRDERNNILEIKDPVIYIEVYVPESYREKVEEILEKQLTFVEDNSLTRLLNENEINAFQDFELEKDIELNENLKDIQSENSNVVVEKNLDDYISIFEKERKKEVNNDKISVQILKIFLAFFYVFIAFSLMIIRTNQELLNFIIKETDLTTNKINTFLIIMLLILILVIVKSDLKIRKRKKRKQKMIAPYVKSMLEMEGYQYSYNGIEKEAFQNTLLYEEFRHYNRFESTDKISGNWKNKNFVMANLKLEYQESSYGRRGMRSSEWVRKRDGIGVFFNGVFFKLQILNEINSRIYIEPIKWYEKCNNFIDYEIALKDSNNFLPYVYHPGNIKEEFEKQYRIYEMGERKGAEILDESFMEELLKLKEKYNLNVSFAFVKDIANIMIDKISLFSDKKMIEEGLNKESCLKEFKIAKEFADVVIRFDMKK